MTHKKKCTHVIKSKGHKRCFTATINNKCNSLYVFRTYCQRLRKFSKRHTTNSNWEKKHKVTHLRIQKTILSFRILREMRNYQVKVHVNTLCILGLCAKCGIKIISWGLPWIYVEPNAFEICTRTTENYAPCKGTEFTTILITTVCMWPSPAPPYLGLPPLTKAWWHRFELIDVIWCFWCCRNVGEGCEDTIDKMPRMPTERWPTCGLP
jgi:hypothetical protein